MNQIIGIVILFSFIFSLEEFNSNYDGGGYIHQNDYLCVSDEIREEIKSKLVSNYLLLKEQGVIEQNRLINDRSEFTWPLRASNNYYGYSYYGISGYVDHNSSYPNQIQDYNCGTRSYDTMSGYNHAGTDIFTWPFSWHIMNNDEVEVISSLDGIILGKDDGHYDQNCNFNNSMWNAVYILHSDGTVGWYGHLKKYSLTDKNIGDTITQGEYLGVLGSSGNSTGPHLHFEVYTNTNQTNLIDPYQGTCNNLNEESFWIDQKPYYDSGLNKLMTHSQAPEFYWNDCAEPANIFEENYFRHNEYIFFAAYFRDQLQNQVTDWYLIDPNGLIHAQWDHTFNIYYSASYWYYYFLIENNYLFGEWKFIISYEGQSYEHIFTIFDNYGDLNFDATLNILDVVIAVDLVINEDYNKIADLNFDDTLNVLDIVILVDTIMDSN